MELLSGKDAAKRITSLISERYQVHGVAVELTIKSIYAMGPNGAVDFGGGEFVQAARVPVASFRKHHEDKYLWWELPRGAYTVLYNEQIRLEENEIGFLEPNDRLLLAGASHPTTFLRGPHRSLETLLHVGTPKVRLKQNARISRLLVFRLGKVPHAVPVLAEMPRKGKKLPAGKKRRK